MDTQNPRKNPYVGPRAFETGEQLYGRDRDITNLYYLFLSERITLLFSPSGAGKSSLIKAGLMPRLTPKFNILPVIRVNLELPPAMARREGINRYVFSALLSMEQNRPENEQIRQSDLAAMTLSEYLAQRRSQMPPPTPPADDFEDEAPKGLYDALIFDQFEEILTIAPNDYDGKRVFFEQLGEALKDTKRWALFAAREDHIAAFDPYLRAIPGRFAARYRLDLLEAATAMQAMQSPAEAVGVNFTDEAAQRLADDLRRVKVQRADGSTDTELGRYIEPVQLQVVCYRLWKNLSGTAAEIGIDQVIALGNVDNALSAYYSEQVSMAAQLLSASEREIREWFQGKLITESGIRSQVIRGKTSSGGLDNNVIRQFENAHILRTEKRAGATWYELAHDRMIEPVRKSNDEWFQANLSLLQRQTLLWLQRERSDGLLLSGKELSAAEEESRGRKLTDEEQEFLDASQKVRSELSLREKRRLRILQALVIGIAIALVGAIVLGILAGFNAQTATVRAQEASTARAEALVQAQAAQTAEADALTKKEEADRQARLARARELAALSTSNLNGKRLEVALLLGIEAARSDENVSGSLLAALGAAPDIRQSLSGGHTAGVNALAYSVDGRYLVSGGKDSLVIVWDFASGNGQPRSLIRAHQAEVRAVAFSPDGKVIASADAANQLVFTDADTGSPLYQAQATIGDTDGITALAYSHDGTKLAIAASQKSQSQEGKPTIDPIIVVWDVAANRELLFLNNATLAGHSGTITSLAFDPTNPNRLASGGSDGRIFYWDLSDPTFLFPSSPLSGHLGGVTSLAFSPGGERLASGSTDNNIIIWDPGVSLMAAQPILLRTLVGHTGTVNSLAFSPDGARLVSGASDRQVLLWDVNSGQMVGSPFSLHTASVTSVSFDPTGSFIASAGLDTRIILWDANRISRLANLVAIQPFAFTRLVYHPSSNTLVSGGESGSLLVFEGGEGTPSPLTGHTDTITALAFAPDGSKFASASFESNVIRLWDTASRAQLAEFASPDSGIVYSLAFDARGDTLIAGDANGNVTFWDVNSRLVMTVIPAHPTGSVTSLAVSPDGAWFVSGGTDSQIVLWEFASYQPLNTYAQGASLNALAFSPDGLFLASAGLDKLVTLWDVKDGQLSLRATLTGHGKAVTTLAYAPSSQMLASGSEDGSLILWNSRGEMIGQPLVGHVGKVGALVFGSEPSMFFSTGADGRIFRWNLLVRDWIEQACQIVGRNLSSSEWAQYFPNEEQRVTCEQWPAEFVSATSEPGISPTDEPTSTGNPPLTPIPTETPAPPQAQVLGGADRVAFVRNNEIWVMNLDGKGQQQVTFDKRPKRNLQWFPGSNQLVYIAENRAEIVNLDSQSASPLVLFAPQGDTLDDFRLAPDGLHVAIALGNEMFVGEFPFLEQFVKVNTKSDLFSLPSCLIPQPGAPTSAFIKEFRWSASGRNLAWLQSVLGDIPGPAQGRDLVQVMGDISACDPLDLSLLSFFPGPLFSDDGYRQSPLIPSFDWDGLNRFVFNTQVTSDGWGNLYAYDISTDTPFVLKPVGECCYRDARWSPDGQYLFFAFREKSDGAKAATEFYYVSYEAILTGQEFTPLALPGDFFIVSGEAPQPALRTVLPDASAAP